MIERKHKILETNPINMKKLQTYVFHIFIYLRIIFCDFVERKLLRFWFQEFHFLSVGSSFGNVLKCAFFQNPRIRSVLPWRDIKTSLLCTMKNWSLKTSTVECYMADISSNNKTSINFLTCLTF